MTTQADLDAANKKLADDTAKAKQLAGDVERADQAVIDAQALAGKAHSEYAIALAQVEADQADVKRIEAELAAQAKTKTHFGTWNHTPDFPTWQSVLKFAPKNHLFRTRGTSGGRFDFPYDKLDSYKAAVAMGAIPSVNFNPRLGQGGNKTPVKMTDIPAGKYDKDIIAAGKWLANFPDGICEVWSECNVRSPLPDAQPDPWAGMNVSEAQKTAEWEAAFLYIVKLMRANGATMKLGTSMGPQGFIKYQQYVTPKMAAASDFIGLDTYLKTGYKMTQHAPSIRIPSALKVMHTLKIPTLAVCECAASDQNPKADVAAWFTDLVDTVKKSTPGDIWGVIYTNGDSPSAAYVIDAGHSNHDLFVKMAADGVWAP